MTTADSVIEIPLIAPAVSPRSKALAVPRASLALGMDYENQKIKPSNLNYESIFKYTAVYYF